MVRTLISVPPSLRDFLHSPLGKKQWAGRLETMASGTPFVGSDPVERKLGSGGGTLNLLVDSWRASRSNLDLFSWLGSDQRLVLHAGGESRRLPAYAAQSKALLPMPRVAGLHPQRFDQVLADFQITSYQQVLVEAGRNSAVLVTAGDVWLDFNPLQIPAIKADISGVGMRVSPEIARHFGVYFVAKENHRENAGEQPIAFFLQKPTLEEIYRHAPHYEFYVDTGMWLLSLSALNLLFERCGWDADQQRFATADGYPSYLDLYTEIGMALGQKTKAPAALQKLGWAKLKQAVVPLADARFYHLGSSRQLFESFEQIQRSQLSPSKSLAVATHEAAFARTTSLPVWVDSVASSETVRLDGHNLLTGLSPKMKIRHLAQEHCLEIAPIGEDKFILRPFHLDDDFRGQGGAGGKVCGQDALGWLRARSLPYLKEDVFDLPLYPILAATDVSQELLDWFFSQEPNPSLSARFAGFNRISARDLPKKINFGRLFAQRSERFSEALKSEFQACETRTNTRVFDQDFSAIADFCVTQPNLKRWLLLNGPDLVSEFLRPEFQSRLLLLLSKLSTGRAQREVAEEGYEKLRLSLISAKQLGLVRPKLALKEDQIVWGRSPVRLDLAGGWTDTPPYCLEAGGAVLNMAVLLNGQPPIQVFIRPLTDFHFRLKSIDLGLTEDIRSYRELSNYGDPHSNFSLPKAALSLAGFHPDYLGGPTHRTLKDQLKEFGGGLELTLLSAVPKGSGLGTSSILGAVLLAALNRACVLGWDEVDLYNRVLGIEQLLTTGGGWQDQAGALFRSVKFIQTQPGLSQTPSVRYLPDHLLGKDHANQTLLLYYTGATRLAKGILKEIVQDMFLARRSTLQTLALIRANAEQLHQALQAADTETLQRCIGRSWDLNKRLDRGTTTPEIERIIATCGPNLAACKLLGAGGGGYMLICAKNPESGRKIRENLEKSPPNSRARFIDFQLAHHALEVSVS